MIDQDDLIKENTLVSQFTKIKDNDMIVANGFDENPLNYGMIYHSKKHQEKSMNLKYYFKNWMYDRFTRTMYYKKRCDCKRMVGI